MELCDRLAQRLDAERGRVRGESVAQRLDRSLDDWGRRSEIRLADFHVHDAPPGGFERLGTGEHVHHLERLDLRRAARYRDAFEGADGATIIIIRACPNRRVAGGTAKPWTIRSSTAL